MAKVERLRNNGEWTEARYWSQVRSSLRNGFRFWKPITNTKNAARRLYRGDNKRQKYEYKCAKCLKYFPDKDIQVDHIIPLGSLKCIDDLAGFLIRLTVEEGFQVLCTECHNEKTKLEKNERNNNG